MTRIKNTYLAALAVLLSPIAANADFIGDTITANGAGFSTDPVTIGAGYEFIFPSYRDLERLDFGASTLTISGDPESGGHSWGDFGFVTFSGFGSNITGLSIASNFGYSGDILSDFSFTSDSITLHWGESRRNGKGELVFDIASSAVPEPGTLALLGLGLAGIGFARRKKV